MIYALALLFPFLAIIALLVWGLMRRSSLERCRRLFVKITAHPRYKAVDTPKLIDAVRDADEAYLRIYLRRISDDAS